MGEPLSNYDAVVSAVQLMTDPRVFGLSRRHVTVSTVGVIPKIKQMATDLKVRPRRAKGGLEGLVKVLHRFSVLKQPSSCCGMAEHNTRMLAATGCREILEPKVTCCRQSMLGTLKRQLLSGLQ